VTTAWTAAAVDDLSGGRLRLGLGAGWQEREHRAYGFDLLNVEQRFVRLEEGLEVIRLLLRSDEPVNFGGQYYRLEDALLLPRPRRAGGPPIVIGGNGPRRTLPLAARYADEWNAVSPSPDGFAKRCATLDRLLEAEGRAPSSVKRTAMTRIIFGRDDAELQRKLDGLDVDALRARGVIIGTPGAVVEALGRLAEAGVQRVMAQWLDQDDLDGLDGMASMVLPQLA
jgi:alkanesulfonate monooxygenase SsuD/methylene tetrahydromethanopterin reductase-like flavin-dependent oxidoreductase (luciferase family)